HGAVAPEHRYLRSTRAVVRRRSRVPAAAVKRLRPHVAWAVPVFTARDEAAAGFVAMRSPSTAGPGTRLRTILFVRSGPPTPQTSSVGRCLEACRARTVRIVHRILLTSPPVPPGCANRRPAAIGKCDQGIQSDQGRAESEHTIEIADSHQPSPAY